MSDVPKVRTDIMQVGCPFLLLLILLLLLLPLTVSPVSYEYHVVLVDRDGMGRGGVLEGKKAVKRVLM